MEYDADGIPGKLIEGIGAPCKGNLPTLPEMEPAEPDAGPWALCLLTLRRSEVADELMGDGKKFCYQ